MNLGKIDMEWSTVRFILENQLECAWVNQSVKRLPT